MAGENRRPKSCDAGISLDPLGDFRVCRGCLEASAGVARTCVEIVETLGVLLALEGMNRNLLIIHCLQSPVALSVLHNHGMLDFRMMPKVSFIGIHGRCVGIHALLFSGDRHERLYVLSAQ